MTQDVFKKWLIPNSLFEIFIMFNIVCVICICLAMHAVTHMFGKSEGNMRDLVLSFHSVSPGDGTQITSLDSEFLYLLSLLV